MLRIALALAAAGLIASSTGCCCSHGGYGASYAPAPSPCGPCATPAYGAAPAFGAAPAYGAAPMYAPSGGCPTGNCGAYPSGAFYGPTTPATAAAPVYTSTALLNPLPTY